MSFKHSYNKNPFTFNHWGAISIGFWVPNKLEPLWWIGTGFKDLSRIKSEPQYFQTETEAETIIKEQLINFIKRYRSDQVDLIKGW